MGTIVKHSRRSEVRREPTWVGRAHRRRHIGQRGTSVLEAAMITPVFLLLILALADAGLYMQNYLAVSNTVRAAARAASAGDSKVGGVGHAQVSSDLYTVLAASRESTAIPRSRIQYIVVYKATGFGAGPTEEDEDGVPSGCLNGVPRAGQCNVYTVADFVAAEAELAERTRHQEALETNPTDQLNMGLMRFGCGPSSPDRFWCPNTREVRLSGNGGNGPDYVGVYMKIRHEWLTGIFGDGRFITDQSVVKIEPQER